MIYQATRNRNRSAVSAYAKPGYKRVARMLGYSLLIGDPDAWHGLTLVLTAHLNQKERAALAWASLRSLTPDQVVAVRNAVLPNCAGQPIAPLFNHMDEAAFWADMAEPAELEAYCLASFTAMPRGRQSAFLEYVHGRAEA